MDRRTFIRCLIPLPVVGFASSCESPTAPPAGEFRVAQVRASESYFESPDRTRVLSECVLRANRPPAGADELRQLFHFWRLPAPRPGFRRTEVLYDLPAGSDTLTVRWCDEKVG